MPSGLSLPRLPDDVNNLGIWAFGARLTALFRGGYPARIPTDGTVFVCPTLGDYGRGRRRNLS